MTRGSQQPGRGAGR